LAYLSTSFVPQFRCINFVSKFLVKTLLVNFILLQSSSCIAHDTLNGSADSEEIDLIWAKVILDMFEGDSVLDLLEALKIKTKSRRKLKFVFDI
jgi:hypothetical protein